MTVGQLLAALDAARDDAARLALLNAAPRKVREQAYGTLFYRRFVADCEAAYIAECAAFEGFERQLEAAADDDARLRIITAAEADPKRGRTWLGEWSWRRGANAEDSKRRYLQAACGVDTQASAL